jgi:CheY-like chemotaxis protein
MHKKTILLVDDNAIQATIRRTILERNGYSVISALNATRALEQLQDRSLAGEIDLVITDHIMPGMSGSMFAHAIRAINPQLPILVISGMEEAFAEYTGLNVEFRTKPLQPDHLIKCVRQMAGPLEAEASLEPFANQASA